MALVALPVIFPVVSKSTRVIVSILLLGGIAAAISSGNLELGLFVESFNEMSPLVALVAAAMLLGMALQREGSPLFLIAFYTCTRTFISALYNFTAYLLYTVLSVGAGRRGTLLLPG